MVEYWFVEYLCLFCYKLEQTLFQHIGGLLPFVKVSSVVTLWFIRLSFVIACYKFVVAHWNKFFLQFIKTLLQLIIALNVLHFVRGLWELWFERFEWFCCKIKLCCSPSKLEAFVVIHQSFVVAYLVETLLQFVGTQNLVTTCQSFVIVCQNFVATHQSIELFVKGERRKVCERWKVW